MVKKIVGLFSWLLRFSWRALPQLETSRVAVDVSALAQLLLVMNTGSWSVLVSVSKVLVTVPRFPIAVTRSGIANEGRRKIMCNVFILRGSQQS